LWEKPPGGYRNGIATLNFLDRRAVVRSERDVAVRLIEAV
jgi:hypothetical protein